MNSSETPIDPDEDVEVGDDVTEDVVEEAEAPEDGEESVDDSPSDSPPDPAHVRLLEAILFASSEPLSERMLANRLPENVNLKALLAILKDDYAERGVNLIRAGKSWAFRTAPELAQQLNKEIDVPRKLSRAAIETLAVIAYHQPLTRAEIEEVRGVGLSKGTMDVLLEASWIKPRGRRRTPGRPMTWGTTDGFLDHFGLEDIRDLPGMDDLKAAGLLDSGPAISVYTSAAGENGVLEDTHDDTENQLELIQGGDDPLGDGTEDEVEEDTGEEAAEEE
ncbi:MAG: SMC-Scp complex subunit ScpB, partial [Alphaproteobacteria bacterium]|nr:SMC-Scp complex subunit ScpB [Alphaproteobacteria bacterium]